MQVDGHIGLTLHGTGDVDGVGDNVHVSPLTLTGTWLLARDPFRSIPAARHRVEELPSKEDWRWRDSPLSGLGHWERRRELMGPSMDGLFRAPGEEHKTGRLELALSDQLFIALTMRR